MEMQVHPTKLTDGEVRKTLIDMAQAITLQDQAMTALTEQQGVPRENPPASTMANSLRDFMKMNPLIYTGSKIGENIVEECWEAMLHVGFDLLRITIHVKHMEEKRNTKHNRTGSMSRQAEKNFSRKSSTEIRDKPKFRKGLFH